MDNAPEADVLDEYVLRGEVMERLIRKLYAEVEYEPSEVAWDPGNGRQSVTRQQEPQVSGYDTHGQTKLSPDEERVLREVMGFPRLRAHDA